MALLRKQGHHVVTPAEVGMAGAADARHLAYAVTRQLILLTRNRIDFFDLHELVQTVGGSHAGILVTCFDDDREKDMKPKATAAAIGKLARSEVAHRSAAH